MAPPTAVIGIDVGGTNTDCAVVSTTSSSSSSSRVIGSAKRPTTSDRTAGIVDSVRAALASCAEPKPAVLACTLGTTHFVNAVVQRRGLAKVAVLRLCGSATQSIAPLVDWPADLRDAVLGCVHLLPGGNEFDGSEIAALDEGAVRAACADVNAKGIRAVAIAGVFSPVRPEHEVAAARVVREELGNGVFVTLSHSLGEIGLLERENAAVLNASLQPLAAEAVPAFGHALASLGLSCPLLLSSNDGTIMSKERAIELPILTFSSGPTNTMRGAAFLLGCKDAVVVDIGGTTSDVGALAGGFPRERGTGSDLAGIRSNFRMPLVVSIGLGGGSLVEKGGGNGGNGNGGGVTVGPVSVGYKLHEEALVFGGQTLTATDVAVAAGLAPEPVGDASLVASLDPATVAAAVDAMQHALARLVDDVRVSEDPVDVIVCGGGSILVDIARPIPGAKSVVRPDHFGVVNAVGAAIAQVSGVAERVVEVAGDARDKSLAALRADAVKAAVAAGASEGSVEVVDVEEVPIPYVPGGVARVRVRAVGDLALLEAGVDGAKAKAKAAAAAATAGADAVAETAKGQQQQPSAKEDAAAPAGNKDNAAGASPSALGGMYADAVTAKPPVFDDDGAWVLDEQDVAWVALGAAVLGSGGGGSPYHGKLRAWQALRDGRRIRVVPPSKLADDALVACAAMIGAPTILVERMPNGNECPTAMRAVLRAHTGSATSSVDAVTPLEIGGCNSVEPMLAAALADVPLVDADGMGRAFPKLDMLSFFIEGLAPCPSSMCDNQGNSVVFEHVASSAWLEKLMRTNVVAMGLTAGLSLPPLTGEQVRKWGVTGTLSQSWRLGRLIDAANHAKHDPVAAVAEHLGGCVLLPAGKVTSIVRDSSAGFVKGTVKIAPLGGDKDDGAASGAAGVVEMEFQNENLIARGGDGAVLAVVPDLITLFELDTGKPLTTEDLRFGQRVALAAFPCSPLMRSERAMPVCGPAAFGFEGVEYKPVGEYREPKPVWDDRG